MRLLVADDEEHTLKGIVERLDPELLGLTAIESAADGEEALAKAAGFAPDIVLTDVRMPHVDGVEVARRIRAANPRVKIIFMSGYADKAYLKAAIEIGALCYLDKPLDMTQIEQAVKSAVERLRAEAAKEAMFDATKALVESELARRLSEGREVDRTLSELIGLTGIPLSPNTRALTVMFRVGAGSSPPQGSAEIDELCRRLRARLLRSPFFALISVRPGRIVVAHILARNREDYLLTRPTVANIVRRLITPADGMPSVTAGVGDPASGIQGLAASVASAQAALDAAFFGSAGGVVEGATSFAGRHPADEGFLTDYARCLASGDADGATSAVRRAVEMMSRPPLPSVSFAGGLFRKLLARLMTFRDGGGLGSARDDHEDAIWLEMESGATATEAADRLCAETVRVVKQLADIKREGRIIAEVKRYILEHYSNPATSVESIAEAVRFSPAYLCTRFKEGTGTTINRYLTEVRLNRAKELLVDSHGPKISEIAASVGWTDADYFARVFRKATARSPSEFREQIRR